MKRIALIVMLSQASAAASFLVPSSRRNSARVRRRTRRWTILVDTLGTESRTSSLLLLLQSKEATPEPSTTSTTTSQNKKKIDPEQSTFWYAVARKDEPGDKPNDNQLLPCVPTLDREGPLPAGAYLTLGGGDDDEPQRVCRISVSVDGAKTLASNDNDSDDTTGPQELVSSLQQFIDAGLTSFQIKSPCPLAEEHIFGRLRQQTPASVMNECHLTVPLVPSSLLNRGNLALTTRRTVLETLGRIGGDALNNVQLEYQKNLLSPYHLDVLDCLQDLQREGYVRSISDRNMPFHLLVAAELECGFSCLESHQINANLLDPNAYTKFMEQQQQSLLLNNNKKIPLLLSSPLAGGLLTDRFLGKKLSSSKLLLLPQYHMQQTLPKWAMQQQQQQRRRRDGYDDDLSKSTSLSSSSSSLWNTYYQSVLLATLQDVARKHGVSVASVVLRWCLQLDQVASAVVTSRLSTNYDDEERRKPRRPQALRQVFTFELDQDDMKRLWEVSGQEKPLTGTPSIDFDEEERFVEMTERTNGLFLEKTHSNIDLSNNRRLWL